MRDEGDLNMHPEPGSNWDHKSGGYGVSIPDDLAYDSVRIKDANDARWQTAVAYVRDDDAETLYVRPRDDFLAKFTLRVEK
jgi:hypothetical protein